MAAPVQGRDLVGKLRTRHKDAKLPEDAADTLMEVYKFLTANETPIQHEMTHQVLRGYSDWWDSAKSSKMLAIAEDYRCENLNKLIGTMFDMGAPLTLGEKRTQEFKLIQEIEIRGSTTSCISAEELVAEKSAFLEVVVNTMAELYPLESLHLFVLDGSGKNHQLGVQQTCIRLVWGNIIVNKDRACHILDYLVHKLTKSDNQELKDVLNKANEYHKDTSWKFCLKDTCYITHDVIRMTFNDSVTSPPLIRPEERPLKPIKIYEIRPRADAKPELEQLPDEFSRAEWVQFTSIRMPGGITITEWKAPEFKGEQRVAPRFPAQGDGFNGAAGARMGGKVHMRTRGGSDDNNKRSGGPRPLKQEVNENKTRYFYGTIQEFKDNLALKLGDTGTFQEFNDQKRVTWTASAELGTKIEFREINKQVTITGKEGSVRHMLSTMGFLSYEPPAGYAASETGSRARTSVAGSKAPSKVFESNTRAKPSSIAALSAVKEAPRSNRPSALMEVPYEREVCDELLEVYESELVLRLGDIVDVTEDPHMESDNLERWVFGKNRNTGEQGWFSLAFTRAVGQGA